MPAQVNWFDKLLAASLPIVPRPIVRKVAKRYVAGETLDEAVERLRQIEKVGACATVDVLGEEIEEIEPGQEAVEAYFDVLETIRGQGLDANISVKLTAFGLKIDPEVSYERLRSIVARAAELGNFVRIDMEDSPVTTVTLEHFRRLREEGFDNVGAVIQAYMRRTRDDVASLADLTPSYRLCKGIYVEPEEVAYQGFQEVNDNYLATLRQMLEGGSYVGIATHDHALVDGAEKIIEELDLKRDQYEFQMLLGVDEPLGRRLVERGHRLRIYLPYGKDWYAYCIRRLKENPRIGRYVLLGMFKGH